MLDAELLGRAAENIETEAQAHYDRSNMTTGLHARNEFDRYLALHKIAASLWKVIQEQRKP